jgi:hypothetical protein
VGTIDILTAMTRLTLIEVSRAASRLADYRIQARMTVGACGTGFGPYEGREVER